MARYENPRSVTVDDTATGVVIKKPVVVGDTYEVAANDAKIWVNVNGGSAAKNGDDCIPVPKDGAVNVTVTRKNITTPPQLKAIRDAAISGSATVTRLLDVEG